MIKAIVFDIGGVLAFDVWENLLLGEKGIAARYDLDIEKVERVGKELWDHFAYLPLGNGSTFTELEEEYWRLFTKKLQFRMPINRLMELSDKFIRPVHGMISLLEAIKSTEIELAICSNNTEFWFRRQMAKLGLDRFFDSNRIILSCHIGAPKRSKDLEMFIAVLHSMTAEKQEMIFIDDRPKNIERALSLGIPGVIFPSHSRFGHRYLRRILEAMNVLS